MKSLFALLLIITIVSCSTTKKNLLGYWYEPKTMINVRFHADKSFEYNDYDSAANKPKKLSGKYSMKDNQVILEFADNTKQTLSFDKANPRDNYYLKKDDSYFINDSRVNNAVPPDTLQKKMR